jgi:hypothetical protein
MYEMDGLYNTCMKQQIYTKFCIKNPGKDRPTEEPRHRYKDNIEIGFGEIDYKDMNWIQELQDYKHHWFLYLGFHNRKEFPNKLNGY